MSVHQTTCRILTSLQCIVCDVNYLSQDGIDLLWNYLKISSLKSLNSKYKDLKKYFWGLFKRDRTRFWWNTPNLEDTVSSLLVAWSQTFHKMVHLALNSFKRIGKLIFVAKILSSKSCHHLTSTFCKKFVDEFKIFGF